MGRGQGTQSLGRNGKEFGFSIKCYEKPLNDFKGGKTGDSLAALSTLE